MTTLTTQKFILPQTVSTPISEMTTIISPQTISYLVNGVYFYDGIFYNKYKDVLANTSVVSDFWSNENSKFGCDIADVRTANFCAKYGILTKQH